MNIFECIKSGIIREFPEVLVSANVSDHGNTMIVVEGIPIANSFMPNAICELVSNCLVPEANIKVKLDTLIVAENMIELQFTFFENIGTV